MQFVERAGCSGLWAVLAPELARHHPGVVRAVAELLALSRTHYQHSLHLSSAACYALAQALGRKHGMALWDRRNREESLCPGELSHLLEGD